MGIKDLMVGKLQTYFDRGLIHVCRRLLSHPPRRTYRMVQVRRVRQVKSEEKTRDKSPENSPAPHESAYLPTSRCGCTASPRWPT